MSENTLMEQVQDLTGRMDTIMLWTLAIGSREEIQTAIRVAEARRAYVRDRLKDPEPRRFELARLTAWLSRLNALEQFRNTICNVMCIDRDAPPAALRNEGRLPDHVRWPSDPKPVRLWTPGDPE